MQKLIITGGIAAAFLSVTGCQSEVWDQNRALRIQNLELQEKVNQQQNTPQVADDGGQMASMQGQLAEKDQMIADLQSQLQNQPVGATPDASGEFGDITVTRNDAAGTLTVTLPGDILFGSGDAALKTTAKTTLDKVAAAIKKEYADKKIMVDGHTDADPISKSKAKWKDNLDLSAARARTVADYLVSQGLGQKLVHTRAMSDTDPKKDKAASRRVEIVVATR